MRPKLARALRDTLGFLGFDTRFGYPDDVGDVAARMGSKERIPVSIVSGPPASVILV